MVIKKNISKHLIIGSIIILVSLIANVLFAWTKRIDEPIFFEHFIEEAVYNNNSSFIEIHYITNANDTRKLMNLKFEELSNYIYVEHNNEDNGKYYKHHIAHLQIVFCDEDMKKLEDNKKIVLKNAIAQFSDGKEQAVDIGEIVLLPIDKNKERLRSTMSSSSSNHTSRTSYDINKKIKITKVESEILDEASNIFKVGISAGSDLYSSSKNRESRTKISDIKFPIVAENTLTIDTEAVPDSESFFFCRMLLKLSYEDDDGNSGIIEVLNMRYEPYLSEKNIREYVKSKGE
ncbi:hypothetical protein SH2C18_00050 [Clostridium sediminicola]|uniref:hypothetical protein n=1 Tax=Clostridium sediminicola TaxID=3114879 RepID=UPI0031F1D5B6